MSDKRSMTPGQALHKAYIEIYATHHLGWEQMGQSYKDKFELIARATIAADPVRERLVKRLNRMVLLVNDIRQDKGRDPITNLVLEETGVVIVEARDNPSSFEQPASPAPNKEEVISLPTEKERADSLERTLCAVLYNEGYSLPLPIEDSIFEEVKGWHITIHRDGWKNHCIDIVMPPPSAQDQP